MKKILLGLGALGVAVALVPLFAAFEAHVVNVTATIENALSVNTDPIDFGTVFPQEQLDEDIDVLLSQSFLDEDRVDDVQYVIRQKPKCRNAQTGATATGHVTVDPQTGQVTITCPQDYELLPLLCRYLSKHPDGNPEPSNDGTLPAFHEIGQAVQDPLTGLWSWVWNDVLGLLVKSDNDIEDNWTIDLKTPCFEGNCGQDWENFVLGINPQADPNAYIQPQSNEHELFGCDLWIEVTGVSEAT